MFKFFRKTECQKVRGKLSEYLDGRLPPEKRKAIESHIGECEACRHELESLKATVNLLRRMPQVPAPRSFTLAETGILAKTGREVSFFGASLVKWLRPATAVVVVLFVALLLTDFIGVFTYQPAGKGLPVPAIERTPSLIPTPVPTPTPPPPPRTEEAKPRPLTPRALKAPSPSKQASVKGERPTPAGPKVTPTPPLPPAPKAEAKEVPQRKVPLWLRSLEITFGALTFILAGLLVFIWRKEKLSKLPSFPGKSAP